MLFPVTAGRMYRDSLGNLHESVQEAIEAEAMIQDELPQDLLQMHIANNSPLFRTAAGPAQSPTMAAPSVTPPTTTPESDDEAAEAASPAAVQTHAFRNPKSKLAFLIAKVLKLSEEAVQQGFEDYMQKRAPKWLDPADKLYWQEAVNKVGWGAGYATLIKVMRNIKNKRQQQQVMQDSPETMAMGILKAAGVVTAANETAQPPAVHDAPGVPSLPANEESDTLGALMEHLEMLKSSGEEYVTLEDLMQQFDHDDILVAVGDGYLVPAGEDQNTGEELYSVAGKKTAEMTCKKCGKKVESVDRNDGFCKACRKSKKEGFLKTFADYNSEFTGLLTDARVAAYNLVDKARSYRGVGREQLVKIVANLPFKIENVMRQVRTVLEGDAMMSGTASLKKRAASPTLKTFADYASKFMGRLTDAREEVRNLVEQAGLYRGVAKGQLVETMSNLFFEIENVTQQARTILEGNSMMAGASMKKRAASPTLYSLVDRTLEQSGKILMPGQKDLLVNYLMSTFPAVADEEGVKQAILDWLTNKAGQGNTNPATAASPEPTVLPTGPTVAITGVGGKKTAAASSPLDSVRVELARAMADLAAAQGKLIEIEDPAMRKQVQQVISTLNDTINKADQSLQGMSETAAAAPVPGAGPAGPTPEQATNPPVKPKPAPVQQA